MPKATYSKDWAEIDTTLYNRSARLFSVVKNVLSVKIDLHADPQVFQGDIFLFNHFSRFETFIPQFLIYERSGAYSCAIASSEFFEEDTALSRYLKQVGVFPHDHPRLFPLLAGQILRGRKIIIFPEGGMVKDHQVMDKQGNYSIYSRTAGTRRKQHTGAAVLGQGVALFKAAVCLAVKHNNTQQLGHWQKQLKFDSVDQLIAVASKPTLIVPANITFYPIRSSENLLFKSVELFSEGLSLRQSEELLIEGNILLKNTDMDIRTGVPVNPCSVWDWRTRSLMKWVIPEIKSLDDVFNLSAAPKNVSQRVLGKVFISHSENARNQYMEKMYALVTVNLSHLAATLITYYIGQGQTHVEKNLFYSILYIAIKRLQGNPAIHLHRSLLNPDDYSDLLKSSNKRFEFFITTAKDAGLIQEKSNSYQFLPKLCADYHFDTIRLENPIAVYSNEVAPLPVIQSTLIAAIQEFSITDKFQFAAWHFEDELVSLAWEKKTYSRPELMDINQLEIAVADPSPFFIHPEPANGIGILLIHGLFASPAEVREYGQYLAKQGYTVLGIRLKGHGTSPYALRDQCWQDWYGCVQRGFQILKDYCEHLFVIGFSTGGALAIKLAAEHHHQIIGVTAVSVPLKFVNPAFMLVPLLHGTNKLIEWISSYEGIKPFIDNEPEHPLVNYRNTPVRALYELRLLIEQLEAELPKVIVPTLIMIAQNDPVVASKSSEQIFELLGAKQKQLRSIVSNRHGILMENLGGTWQIIDDFLKAHSESLSGN